MAIIDENFHMEEKECKNQKRLKMCEEELCHREVLQHRVGHSRKKFSEGDGRTERGMRFLRA